MASRFEAIVITCPQQVDPSAPVEVPFGVPTGILRGFEIVIPDGHAGLTGIALGYGHRAVIPFMAGSYFSGNDDVLRRLYTDKVPGVPWSAFVCNLDLQPHTWEVRLDYDDYNGPVVDVPTDPIPAADIIAAGTDAMQGA